MQKILTRTQDPLKSKQELNATLIDLQTKQTMNTPDPQTSNQRQKLYEDLQRENCVLTIQNCTATQDGKTGWMSLLNTLKFRNNFTSQQFTSGILKTITIQGNRKTSNVTFLTK